MDYINAFWVGGLICALTQILLDRTKLMPGRIMVLLVCSGSVLGAFKIYPVIQSVVNLVLSVVLVYWLGVPGVLIAKIITSFCLINWTHAYFTYKYTLKCNMGGYFHRMLTYTATTVFVCLIGIWLCNAWFAEYSLANAIYRALSVFTIAVLTIVLLFHRTPEYRQIVNQINEIWNKLCRRSA